MVTALLVEKEERDFYVEEDDAPNRDSKKLNKIEE